jgi:formylglycine-generating enzyme required for sulfatase activity
MFDQYTDGACPQCRLVGEHALMRMNEQGFWECPSCHLQAHTAFGNRLTIMRQRGAGRLTLVLAAPFVSCCQLARSDREAWHRIEGAGFHSESELREFLLCEVTPRPEVPLRPSWPTTRQVPLPGGQTLELVLIPAGEFLMGSPEQEAGRNENEGPLHGVTIARPFYLGKTLVTQSQWEALMGPVRPGRRKWAADRGADYPAYNLSWLDCQEFIGWLNALRQGNFRLPSEAEWEYACRTGCQEAYCFGADPALLDDYAWYWDNSDIARHPVGRKQPNAWGLYDMHGNEREWCQDYPGETYNGAPTDGSARELECFDDGSDPDYESGLPAWFVEVLREVIMTRALRGGDWSASADECRCAQREGVPIHEECSRAGLRVVCDAA